MQESLHAGVISEGRRKAAAVAEERFKEQVARERGLLRVKKARSWGHKLWQEVPLWSDAHDMDWKRHFQHDVLQIFRSIMCFNMFQQLSSQGTERQGKRGRKTRKAGCSREKGETGYEETRSGWNRLEAGCQPSVIFLDCWNAAGESTQECQERRRAKCTIFNWDCETRVPDSQDPEPSLQGHTKRSVALHGACNNQRTRNYVKAAKQRPSLWIKSIKAG